MKKNSPKRPTVALQLGCAFALMSLMCALLGSLSLWSLQRVDGHAQALAEKWLVGIGHLATLRICLGEMRDLEFKHSRTTDPSYHGDYEDRIKVLAAQSDKHAVDFIVLAGADIDAKSVVALEKALAAYAHAVQKVVRLGRGKQHQDAADISDGLASMAYDELIGAVTTLTETGFKAGASAAQSAARTSYQSRVGVGAAMVATVAMGMALGCAITMALRRQLGGEPAQAVALAASIAEGNLENPVNLRPGDRESLLARLGAMQISLAGAVSRVREGACHVATASTEIAQENQDLSARTEQQACALQQTAATMDQLGVTVHRNADSAQQASQLADGATIIAERGGQVVDEVVATMRGINDSSGKIAEIVGVIDGIAFQTNILALNAAVEAARAGEQGRGFAVVASEVRSLAQRSAHAAKDIKQLIADSVERVEHGAGLASRAGRTMAEVVSSIQGVSEIVREISVASTEQRRGVVQVGESIGQMDHNTQRNAAMVEHSAAAAENLRLQAAQLVEAVAVFRMAGQHGEPLVPNAGEEVSAGKEITMDAGLFQRTM